MGRAKKGTRKAAGSKGSNPPQSKSNSNNPSSNGVGKSTSDRSQLNFPYDIRLQGFSSLQNAVNKGTPKLRRILTEECDFLMECRVCRNLFRSMPNFVTHKVNHCKKPFDSTWCIGLSNLVQTTDNAYNIEYEVDPELLMDEDVMSDTNRERPASAVLASTVLAHRSTDAFVQTSANENLVRLKIKAPTDSSTGSVVLVQQTSSDPSNCDLSNPTSCPIDNSAKKDTAILGPESKIMCTGSSKSIEAVVSRLKLNAQMKSSETKQAVVTESTSNISCNTFDSVFDSEKALLQRKREGSELGRTEESKLSTKNNPSSVGKSLNDESLVSAKKFKHEEDVEDHSLALVECAPKSKICDKLPKVSSPFQSRRCSNMTSQSPKKPKCILTHSSMKLNQMKHSKCDWSNYVWSCKNCSSKFKTRLELVMHSHDLVRCESSREKIRITVRNDFGKSSRVEVVKTETSHHGDLGTGNQEVTQKNLPNSNATDSGSVLGPVEVTNNRQVKNENCNSKDEPTDNTNQKNLTTNQTSEVESSEVLVVDDKGTISAEIKSQSSMNTDAPTVQVPCMSSSSDSDLRQNAAEMETVCTSTATATSALEETKPLMQMPPVNRRKSKPYRFVNLSC